MFHIKVWCLRTDLRRMFGYKDGGRNIRLEEISY